MANKTDQTVAALQKRNLEAAMQLAQISIENSQRILQLQMETARDLFESGVSNVQALSHVKTPQEAMELRARAAQQTAEKMFSTSRDIAEITAGMQDAMSKLVSQQLTSGSQELISAVQGMLQGMPLNSHAAAETMQSTFEAARKTLEQVAKASSDAFSAVAKNGKKD
ncbi:phasin family protein [Viridibacterium curvum]|uniref:Phasin domain-containing protein n=1 Tax=Viridibacterium curvum TaxID=1101404 RepID=A0ABP9QDD7_9RHOO